MTAPYPGNIFNPLPACPATQGGGGGQPPPSPAELALEFWHEVPLPQPQPSIAPGRAITGKPAFLETRGERRAVFTRDTPNGPLSIEATGVYYVDWGDGTTGGPYPFEGGPWPDGKITHEYIDVGSYDVVVTERWSATWRLGGESGTLEELRTSGTIDDFPVEQVQAVRER